MQCPSCVFPATENATATIAALCHAMLRRRKVALVRYVLAANRPMALGVLVPRVLQPHACAEGADRCPSHFLLIKLAWGSDFYKLTLPAMEDSVVCDITRSLMSPIVPYFLELLSQPLKIVENCYLGMSTPQGGQLRGVVLSVGASCTDWYP